MDSRWCRLSAARNILSEMNNPYNLEEEKALQQMLVFGMLCNHSELVVKEEDYTLDGDPTEGALLVSAMKAGFDRPDLLKEFTILNEFPFDSARKMMSMHVKDKQGRHFIVTKGAPDVILGISDFILWDEKSQSLGKEIKIKVQEAINGLASKALRTIAIAFKPVPTNTIILSEQEAEKKLNFYWCSRDD